MNMQSITLGIQEIFMLRLFQTLLFSIFLTQIAFAAELTPTLDGESFTNQFVGKQPNGDKLLEFVRPTESFNNWTKLVGYRYQQLPALSNDPMKYALAMERLVKQTNPQAAVKISRNEQSGEAIVDFLTWPQDQSYMELNVFRFWKSKDGNAVVSVQLANKFVAPKPERSQNGANEYQRKLNEVRERRQNWIKQVADISIVAIEEQLVNLR
ncbi:MAG: hypothetical protein IPO00_14610 [Betaproteobacteria bacterium]|nr:hypothetical protein [Betaproteobacteria bacterium]